MNTLTPLQQDIAVGAYHLYLIGGSQHGRDWDHWFQAEQLLRAKSSAPIVAKAPVAKKAAKKAVAKKAPAKKVVAKK